MLPYRRFAVTLTSANARLGADADRYSFTVVDFHLLLFAGFNRRTINQEFCAKAKCRMISCAVASGGFTSVSSAKQLLLVLLRHSFCTTRL